nr:DEAD/DEAH box helicase [Planctomycetota bacterium]
MSSIPFAAVPESVREALLARGFTALTSVQEAVLSDAARQRDLRISSQTGSGKTVALGFAVVDLLEAPASAGQAGPRVLLVAPTRELAQQVASELTWLFAKLASVNVVCVTGGTALGPERRALSRCDSVVVGTPGRLNDHLRSGALNLSSLRCLVLDEADQML